MIGLGGGRRGSVKLMTSHHALCEKSREPEANKLEQKPITLSQLPGRPSKLYELRQTPFHHPCDPFLPIHRLLLLKPPFRCPSSFPFDQRHLESKSCLPPSLQPPTFLFESVHPLFIFPHSTAPSNPSSPPEFPAPAPLTPINNLFVSKTFSYRFNRQEHYFQHAKRDEADI